MTSNYLLHYWPVPFRGQFVRAVLAFAGKTWAEVDADTIADLMDEPLAEMPVPFKGPPLLVDRQHDVAIAQMPAIVMYLGETLELLPTTAALRAMTLKVVLDANDVIDEITQQGGQRMWTAKRWEAFVPRLQAWMTIWEETGRRHGLTADSGHLLGGDAPGICDVVTAVLWSTLTERFTKVDALLRQSAPMTAALARRVSALPPLAALAATARDEYGDDYCGGRIGASMKTFLND